MADREETALKIAWGITGAGHFLPSCVKVLGKLNQADVFLSKAGQEVLSSYSLYDQLKDLKHVLFHDEYASCPPVTGLYTNKYDLVVIAPVTANSIAKMAHGIADNLITNLFAHAGKCQIPVILLPCDAAPKIKSYTPQGKEVLVHLRQIDRENLERLAGWDGVIIAHNPQELKGFIEHLLLQKVKKGPFAWED
ncbi:MAG: flavoprotein [Dehalobacterium sp.]